MHYLQLGMIMGHALCTSCGGTSPVRSQGHGLYTQRNAHSNGSQLPQHHPLDRSLSQLWTRSVELACILIHCHTSRTFKHVHAHVHVHTHRPLGARGGAAVAAAHQHRALRLPLARGGAAGGAGGRSPLDLAQPATGGGLFGCCLGGFIINLALGWGWGLCKLLGG